MTLFTSNAASIGNTPLVLLRRCLDGAKATVLAKIESRNPAGSVKCRVGAALIADAERRGLLREGRELIEPTSGNTGIGLAFFAAAKNIPLTLVMPENMSVERRKLLSFFGAKLLLTPKEQGMGGSIRQAEKMAAGEPERYLLLQQFENPANPAIHETSTGPEIWADTNGTVDILVAGVGTGGTITGISRYIKKSMKKSLVSVAVEPADSPVIAQTLGKQPLTPKPHAIQGIGAGFIPKALDLSLIDAVEPATSEEAIEMAQRLGREEGILSGISGGAAVSVAARLARKPENKGKTIVVIVPDSAERYLSTDLFSA